MEYSEDRRERVIGRIIANYKINDDYIIKKEPVKNSKTGQSKNSYYLTLRVAKKIMLASKAKNGEQVRDYFIQVEGLLIRYLRHIIYSLNLKYDQILNGKKPIVNPKAGIMYIIEVKNKPGFFKIGKTTDMRKRAASHNCALSEDLIIKHRFEVENVDAVDSCVKISLKPSKVRNDREIYNLNSALAIDIILKCEKFIKETNGIIGFRGLQRTILSNLNNNSNYYLVIDKCASNCATTIKQDILDSMCKTDDMSDSDSSNFDYDLTDTSDYR
jgi:phage anti-repressor protein